MWVFGLLMRPRIEELDSGFFEIPDVARHHAKIMDSSYGGNEEIRLAKRDPSGLSMGHHPTPRQNDLFIDLENPARKPWSKPGIDPLDQDLAKRWVGLLLDPITDFGQGHRAQK